MLTITLPHRASVGGLALSSVSKPPSGSRSLGATSAIVDSHRAATSCGVCASVQSHQSVLAVVGLRSLTMLMFGPHQVHKPPLFIAFEQECT